MAKSNIILENENILLISDEVIVEGLLVSKIKASGRIVLLDMKGNPVAKINARGVPKIGFNKKIAMKSLTINLMQITLRSEDVEIIPIGSI